MGRRKSSLTAEDRRREGAFLKERWLEYKTENKGATQDELCAELGITQGLLQQLFRGATPIPFELLISLALKFNFHPTELRPSIAPFLDEIERATGTAGGPTPLGKAFLELPRASRQSVMDFVRFLHERDVG